MNRLKGHITEITVNGSMSLVAVTIGETITLKSIVIDTPETAAYLKKGMQLNLLFKETEVVIGAGENLVISIINQIPATITQIESGKLLSKLVLNTAAGKIVSIISSEANRNLQLKKGAKVVAMIKLNEIMLSEC